MEAFYLRCILFPKLVLDVISCLLQHILAFNVLSMSILVGCWVVAIEPNPVKGYAECCPQGALDLDLAFCLVSVLPQIESIVHAT